MRPRPTPPLPPCHHHSTITNTNHALQNSSPLPKTDYPSPPRSVQAPLIPSSPAKGARRPVDATSPQTVMADPTKLSTRRTEDHRGGIFISLNVRPNRPSETSRPPIELDRKFRKRVSRKIGDCAGQAVRVRDSVAKSVEFFPRREKDCVT